MKILAKSILIGVLTFIAFYLIGSFIMADLNISHWTEKARRITAIVGGFMGFVAMGSSAQIMSEK